MHNASVFLVLIFISAWIARSRKPTKYKALLRNASSTKPSAKSKRLILQLSTVTAHTPVGVKHQLRTVVVNAIKTADNVCAGIQ